MTRHKTKFVLAVLTFVFGVLSGLGALAFIVTQYNHILEAFL